MPPLAQRVFCEGLGTAFLLMAVVGSGIMAQRLSGGNEALALLVQHAADRRHSHGPDPDIRAAVGRTLQPGRQSRVRAAARTAVEVSGLAYIAAQLAGGIAGVWAAHLMFELPLVQFSVTVRTGAGQWFAEAVATFGLLLTIFGCVARTPAAVPIAVGLYITAAYWFTASTSFANPAVTIARALSDTFAGISPSDMPGFIAAQLAGMIVAVVLGRWLWGRPEPRPESMAEARRLR